MIPGDGRAFFIDKHELAESHHGRLFLWSCFRRFKELVKPNTKFDDNLVLLWESDYRNLYKNYRPIKENK